MGAGVTGLSRWWVGDIGPLEKLVKDNDEILTSVINANFPSRSAPGREMR
jgi:hypothetical protein